MHSTDGSNERLRRSLSWIYYFVITPLALMRRLAFWKKMGLWNSRKKAGWRHVNQSTADKESYRRML